MIRLLRASSSSTKGDDSYYHHHYNSTIHTSVSIRVTPQNDYLVSWSILWTGFVFTTIVAAYQVYRDQKLLASRTTDDVSSADKMRSMVRCLSLYGHWFVMHFLLQIFAQMYTRFSSSSSVLSGIIHAALFLPYSLRCFCYSFEDGYSLPCWHDSLSCRSKYGRILLYGNSFRIHYQK